MATYQQLIAPSNYYRLNVSITQVSQDIVNNKSKVRVVGSITGMSSYATASWSKSTNSVTIDGASYAPSTAYSLSNGKTVEIFSYERDVSHAADGKKKVSVSWTFTGGDTASSWNPRGTINCSQDMSQIARASTASLSTSTVDYGGAFTVNIDRKSTSFTHTVTVKSAQGNTLTHTNVGTSQGVTIPTSWLGSFTTGSSTSGTVTVQTYNGSTAIGSAVSLGFTINVPRGSSWLESNAIWYADPLRIRSSKAHTTLSHHITIQLPNRSTSFLTTSVVNDYTIPLEWLNGYTTGTNASGTVTIQTKNGSTNIGSPITLYFGCQVPYQYTPTVTVSRTSFNSGLSGFNEPIQGISTMTLTRNASGIYGSTITKTEWWGDGVSASNSSSISFTAARMNPQNIFCKVTDSRGRVAQVMYQSWNYNYSNPTVNVSNVSRCNSDGTWNTEGTSISFKLNFTYTAIGSNKPNVSYYINCNPEYRYQNLNPTNGSQYYLIVERLDKTKSYTMEVVVTDTVGKSSKFLVNIPVSEVLLNFPAEANALGIGRYATQANTMQVGWNLHAYEDIRNVRHWSSGTVNSVGWKRIFEFETSSLVTANGAYGGSFILNLSKTFVNSTNDSYVFLINYCYQKGEIKLLSSMRNAHNLTYLRFGRIGNKMVVSIWYNEGVSNTVTATITGITPNQFTAIPTNFVHDTTAYDFLFQEINTATGAITGGATQSYTPMQAELDYYQMVSDAQEPVITQQQADIDYMLMLMED